MLLWRISEFIELDGAGGLHAPGRWHSAGRRVIYTAGSASLSILEALVRFRERNMLPPDYQLLRIEVPDDAEPRSWTGDLPRREESRAWGDEWLSERSSLLARVPAAVAPYSFNWLINPAHPDAGSVRLVEALRWNWDERLAR